MYVYGNVTQCHRHQFLRVNVHECSHDESVCMLKVSLVRSPLAQNSCHHSEDVISIYMCNINVYIVSIKHETTLL